MTDAPAPASAPTPEPSEPLFPFPPIVGAILGAVIGAAAWALIAHFTGYEVGYVAWGIGMLVGFGSTACGGKGSGIALACAGLALVAIFVGKVGAVQLAMGSMASDVVDEMFTQEAYDQYLEAAQALPVDADTRDLKGFMIDHELTDASHLDAITEEEFTAFREQDLPELESLRDDPPGFEAWRADQTVAFETAFDEFTGTVSVTDEVIDSLSAIDLLFAGLGVWTAWRVGGGGGEKPYKRGQRGQRGAARRGRRDDA